MEHGEVRSRLQLCAASALLAAVENSSDAIEICSDDFQVQVSFNICLSKPWLEFTLLILTSPVTVNLIDSAQVAEWL